MSIGGTFSESSVPNLVLKCSCLQIHRPIHVTLHNCVSVCSCLTHTCTCVCVFLCVLELCVHVWLCCKSVWRYVSMYMIGYVYECVFLYVLGTVHGIEHLSPTANLRLTKVLSLQQSLKPLASAAMLMLIGSVHRDVLAVFTGFALA